MFVLVFVFVLLLCECTRANGERRMENGEQRTANNGEQRTANSERRKEAAFTQDEHRLVCDTQHKSAHLTI